MPDSSPEAEPLFARRTAVRIGAAMLIGVAAVAAFTWWDGGQLRERERFEETTAVGDNSFFSAPPEAAPVFSAEGKMWKIVQRKKVSQRDTEMMRAGRDEARGVTFYRPRAKPKTDELFVKIERNAYLRLVPAAGNPSSP